MEHYRNHVRNGWAVVIFVEIILHLIPFFSVLMRRDVLYSRVLLKLKCIVMFVVTFIHLYFPFHLIQLKSREEKNINNISCIDSKCNYGMTKPRRRNLQKTKKKRN